MTRNAVEEAAHEPQLPRLHQAACFQQHRARPPPPPPRPGSVSFSESARGSGRLAKDERLLGAQGSTQDLVARPASVRLAQEGECSHTPRVPEGTRWDGSLGGLTGHSLESHSWPQLIKAKRAWREISRVTDTWVTLGKGRRSPRSSLPAESRPMHLVPKAASCHSTRERSSLKKVHWRFSAQGSSWGSSRSCPLPSTHPQGNQMLSRSRVVRTDVSGAGGRSRPFGPRRVLPATLLPRGREGDTPINIPSNDKSGLLR